MTQAEARQQLAALGVTIVRTRELREKNLVLLQADGLQDADLPSESLLFAAFGKSKVTLRREGHDAMTWEVGE